MTASSRRVLPAPLSVRSAEASAAAGTAFEARLSEPPPLRSMVAEGSRAMRVSASEPRSCTAKLPLPHSGASRMLFSALGAYGPLGTGANDGSPVTDTLWPGVTVSSALMPASRSSMKM